MPPERSDIPDAVIYEVCCRVVDGMGATEIKRLLEAQGFGITREKIYPLLQKGIERGYLRLVPPANQVLARELATTFGLDSTKIRVVDVTHEDTSLHVALAASDLVLHLIERHGGQDDKRKVHVGIGAGNSAMHIARFLGMEYRLKHDMPPLVLHATTSSWSLDKPYTAPNSFLHYFRDTEPKVDYVGLLASPVVHTDEYETVLQEHWIRPSFEARDNIDIVLLSPTSAGDEHCLLGQYYKTIAPDQWEGLRANMVGDLQWRPYGHNGPIEPPIYRAVSLFTLDELRGLAQQPEKSMVLVAAPCSTCKRAKSDALLPLLASANLRVCNYLVTDARTAREVLDLHQQLSLESAG